MLIDIHKVNRFLKYSLILLVVSFLCFFLTIFLDFGFFIALIFLVLIALIIGFMAALLWVKEITKSLVNNDDKTKIKLI